MGAECRFPVCWCASPPPSPSVTHVPGPPAPGDGPAAQGQLVCALMAWAGVGEVVQVALHGQRICCFFAFFLLPAWVQGAGLTQSPGVCHAMCFCPPRLSSSGTARSVPSCSAVGEHLGMCHQPVPLSSWASPPGPWGGGVQSWVWCDPPGPCTHPWVQG